VVATSRITGDACTPIRLPLGLWTRALAVGAGSALVKSGGDTWFFLTADYAFGYALEKDATDIVTANGGEVVGLVRVPLNWSDFSSSLLHAQSSKAKIVGLANASLLVADEPVSALDVSVQCSDRQSPDGDPPQARPIHPVHQP
jgi:branched-chain amino acid transport system substrate-binding protein